MTVNNIRKRRGVVLLMTLFLIMVMSGGIALMMASSSYLLTLSQQSRGDAQITKIASDLKRLLPTMISKIDSVRDLDYAVMLPLSSESSDGRFRLEASLHSAVGVFNINKISDSAGIPQKPYADFFPSLFVRYPISEPDTFLNIVFDTIDHDSAERQRGSEIVAFSPDFQNGSIENMRQFEQIIARYLTLTDDQQILRIPWKHLIGFEGDKIDINYASAELVSLIAPEVPSETLHRITDLRTEPFESKDQVLSVAPNLTSVYDAWFFLYTAGNSYPLSGEVAMQTDGESNGFRFSIDAQKRSLERLEMIQ